MAHFLYMSKGKNNPTYEQRRIEAWRIKLRSFFSDIDIIDSKLTPQILSNFREQEISQLFKYYKSQIKKENIIKELRDIYEYNILMIREYGNR